MYNVNIIKITYCKKHMAKGMSHKKEVKKAKKAKKK